MARSYTVATAALTLGVHPKWIDNTLSHFSIPGVEQSRQGIRRRLTEDSLVVLRIAQLLNEDLRIPIEPALRAATNLVDRQTYEIGETIRLEIDLATLRKSVAAKLAAAVEVAPVPRRGRPPTQTGRL